LIADFEAKYWGDAQKIRESGTIILPYRITNLNPLKRGGFGYNTDPSNRNPSAWKIS
jgi:hypothetical protein